MNGHGDGSGNGNGGSTSSSTYQNVSYKKQHGTLILNETGYTFYPISNGGCNSNGNGNGNANGTGNGTSTNNAPMKQTWLQVTKHQVSPVTHARHLLKLILQSPQQQQLQQPQQPLSPSKKKPKSLSDTFEFKTRDDVERIRKDVSHRLITTRKIHALNSNNMNLNININNNSSISSIHNSNNRKRTHDEMNTNQHQYASPMSKSGTHYINQNDESMMSMTMSTPPSLSTSSSSSTSSTSRYAYTHLNKSQFKVASCSLLASYPTLRTQHSLLLQPPSKSSTTTTSTTTTTTTTNDSSDTPIISNDADFWATHSIQQSHQFSKITGILSRGLPSTIKSSLDIQLTTANTTATTKTTTTAKKKDSSTDGSSSGGGSGGGGGGGKDESKSGENSSSGGGGGGGPSSSSSGSAITLGVEEMKQIFIMYPAVHAAYEEKVPLELSEELFWRKYLESEYFHRDRGKLGMSARQAQMFLNGSSSSLVGKQQKGGGGGTGGGGGKSGNGGGTGVGGAGDDDDDDGEDKEDDDDGDDGDGDLDGVVGDSKKEDQKKVDESARVATASSNDIFSRKEVELQRLQRQQEEMQMQHGKVPLEAPSLYKYSHLSSRQSNKSIAVGQFDLTSTANTERGSKLLLNTNDDLHPSSDCGKKVIEKYNKHWAMVLNPNDAVAGCDLSALARKSVQVVLDGDDDANTKGGIDREMQRLVNSASAAAATSAASVNLNNEDVGGGGDCEKNGTGASAAVGVAHDDHYYYGDNVLFEELALKNINAYSGNFSPSGSGDASSSSLSLKQLGMEVGLSKMLLDHIKPWLLKPPQERMDGNAFPNQSFGTNILLALTKKIVDDSKTEKDAVKMTNELPLDFRKDFTKLYRRSSELLRHFFALRRLVEIEEKKKLKSKKSKRNGSGDEGNSNGSSNGSSNGNSTSKQSSQKLERISTGLEDVYREMESMKNALPSSELGEKMRKMFIPIMDQLDWASKLHNEGLDLIGNHGVKKPASGFVDVTD